MPIDVASVLTLALPGLGVLAVATARGEASPVSADPAATAPTPVKPGRRRKARGRKSREPGPEAEEVEPVLEPEEAPASDDASEEQHPNDPAVAADHDTAAPGAVDASATGGPAGAAEHTDRAGSPTAPPTASRYTNIDHVETPEPGGPPADRRPAFNPVAARPTTGPSSPAGAPVARVPLVHVPDDLSTLEPVNTVEEVTRHDERLPDATGTTRATWTDTGVLGGDLETACAVLETAWRSGDADTVAAVAAHERSLAWVAWVTAACVDPNPARPRYVGLAWRTLREAAAAASIDVDSSSGRAQLADCGYAGLLPEAATRLFADLRVIVDVAGTPIRVDMSASPAALAYAQAAVAAANGDLLSLDDLLATLPSHPLGSLLEAVADEFDQDRYVVGAMRQDAWGLVFAHLGLLRTAKTNPQDAAAITTAADRVRELLILLSPVASTENTAPGERSLEAASGTLVIAEPDGSRLRVRVRDLVTDGVYWQAWAAARRNEPHLARVLLNRIPDAPGTAALLATLD